MKYGYERVSTTGQSLEAQLDVLKEKKYDEIYVEKFTGTRKKRPAFQKLLRALEAGNTLVVTTKIDRFSRSTRYALETIESLFSRQIRVHVLNVRIIEDTPTAKANIRCNERFRDLGCDLSIERT